MLVCFPQHRAPEKRRFNINYPKYFKDRRDFFLNYSFFITKFIPK